MNWFAELVSSSPFLNGFWLFVGIVAGAAIQHLLNRLTAIRQSKNALRVLQTELSYNLQEVDYFKKHILKLKGRISARQVDNDQLFLPMHRFDYSAIAPLMNAGYFYLFLGSDRMRDYLEFNNFFRTDNGQFLTEQLREEHEIGKSIEMLEWLEGRCDELVGKVTDLPQSKLSLSGTKLITKKT